MHTLTEQEILTLWERGLRQHPLERTLTLLTAALPGVSRNDLLNLSIGQRDAYLLLLREQNFGTSFVGFAECQACAERLEFSFDSANVWVGAAPIEHVGQTYQYSIDGYELLVRLPTTADLLAAARERDGAAARQLLLQSCIIQAAHVHKDIQVAALPDSVVQTLGEKVLASDPQAEILIDLRCLRCEQKWSAIFDISAFLWAEIQRHAGRLLYEVHALAQAYGWNESEVLALSSTRRQFYLEMVS
jgi:hypothetical protein